MNENMSFLAPPRFTAPFTTNKRFTARAGIEGTISFLKRVFGLYRCTWRTLQSFKAYIHVSIIASNLLILARYAAT